MVYVGKISKYRRDLDRVPEAPADSLDEEGYNVQEVEEIIDGKRKRGKWEFLVKWKGFGPEDNEWIREDELEGAKDAVNKYKRDRLKRAKEQKPKAPPKRSRGS